MHDTSVGDLHGGSIAVLHSEGGLRLYVKGDSEHKDFPILRAGKKAVLRFAFGQPGRRGTIWRLWA